MTLVSWLIALKLASNELTVSPDALALALAIADAEAIAVGLADAIAVGEAVGDGVAADEEQPATIAATANRDIATFLVSKMRFPPESSVKP